MSLYTPTGITCNEIINQQLGEAKKAMALF